MQTVKLPEALPVCSHPSNVATRCPCFAAFHNTPMCCQAARAADIALPVTSQDAGSAYETLEDRVSSSWKLTEYCNQSA